MITKDHNEEVRQSIVGQSREVSGRVVKDYAQDTADGQRWMGNPLERVYHPAHYQAGGMEAIDVIEAYGLGFHLGNAVKYILRAGRKGKALEDLQKARWYIDREIQRVGTEGRDVGTGA